MRNATIALAALVAAGCNAGPYCDGEAADDALMAAAPGDVVELGACEVMGPLRVPPGVELAGQTGTVVVAPRDSGGVVLLGGPSASVVRDLEVRVEGRIGVLFRGGGAGRMERVRVDARRGIGMGAEGMASLELIDVELIGPVDEVNASDARWLRVLPAPIDPASCPGPGACDCEPGAIDEANEQLCNADGRWATWTATFGLVLTRVASADLSGVTVRGFAEWGAVLTDSGVRWVGGGVEDTLGVGVRQVGGTLDLEDVAAERTHAGLRGARPYGIVTTDGGRLEGLRVTVSDNDRYGVLLSGATGLLEDLVAERNGDAALWVAGSDDFELCGTATTLSDNAFAGAVVVGSSGVRLADGSVAATAEQERPVGALGVLRVGDGVHVIDATGPIQLQDVTLSDNDRSGILVDLGSMGTGNVTFAGVTVSGSGAQLGAVAGRPGGAGQLTAEAPAGWDSGITRSGAVGTNDAMFTGSISAVTESLPAAVAGAGDPIAVVAPMF